MMNFPLITFHSGGEGHRPNSLNYLEEAVLLKPDIIEVDIRQSRDHIVLLSHDNYIETNGVKYVLKDFDFEDLLALHPPLLTLGWLLDYARDNELFLNLDVKEIEVIEPMAEILNSHSHGSNIIVSGCHGESIKMLRKMVPGLRVLMNVEESLPEETIDYKLAVEKLVTEASLLGCCGLNVNYRHCRRQLINYAALRSMPVMVWTVDEERDMEKFLSSGVASITTNKVRILRKLIGRQEKMKFDITMIGHISKDIMIYKDEDQRFTGGPVIYSSASAVRSGCSVRVITSASEKDDASLDVMREDGVDVLRLDSRETTSIENIYFTADREKRQVTLLSQADPFSIKNFDDTPSSIFHMAGLFRGEIPDEFIPFLAARGQVAVDAQGLLRCHTEEGLLFKDWEAKKELMPFITYLKTDAAEAEILTGETDREKAAIMLASWGADEVMVTHNSEVLVYANKQFYRAPYTPENLSGRTGRGDTTFAAYIAKRLTTEPHEAVSWCAALCSLKMEAPGPFRGTTEQVRERMTFA